MRSAVFITASPTCFVGRTALEPHCNPENLSWPGARTRRDLQGVPKRPGDLSTGIGPRDSHNTFRHHPSCLMDRLHRSDPPTSAGVVITNRSTIPGTGGGIESCCAPATPVPPARAIKLIPAASSTRVHPTSRLPRLIWHHAHGRRNVLLYGWRFYTRPPQRCPLGHQLGARPDAGQESVAC